MRCQHPCDGFLAWGKRSKQQQGFASYSSMYLLPNCAQLQQSSAQLISSGRMRPQPAQRKRRLELALMMPMGHCVGPKMLKYEKLREWSYFGTCREAPATLRSLGELLCSGFSPCGFEMLFDEALRTEH